MGKAGLRRIMKERLAALPPEVFRAEGSLAAERLCDTALWRRFRRVLLYRTMRGEIDTWPLIARGFSAGKELYFPKTDPETFCMEFFRVDAPGNSGGKIAWRTGNFGIIEPALQDESRRLDLSGEPFLVIAPGLAFDRRGGRMGRGRGYYDRFFASLDPASFTVSGFCLDCQIVARVPLEPFDYPLDALCTGSAFLSF